MMLERIQFITSATAKQNHFDAARKACEAGVKWIQYRNKNPYSKTVLDEAIKLKKICKEYKVTLIINDNPSLANEVQADGVHLGKEDGSVQAARNFLKKDFLIGASCHSVDDIIKAQQAGANYVGLGPFRFTQTKTNLNDFLGKTGFKKIMKEYSDENLTIPVYAIGGVKADDVEFFSSIGIYGVAVSSAITQNDDWCEAVKSLQEKFKTEKIIENG